MIWDQTEDCSYDFVDLNELRKTNNNDTQNEVSGITLKDGKNNGLSVKNTSEVITPNHTQTNSDDINVAQGNSQHLTEQYKRGELKLGQCYFVKLKNGKITPQMYSFVCIDGRHHCTDFGLCVGNVAEVLAPVPSYEEWQDTEKRSLLTTEFSNEIDELNEENQQLKELLSKARDSVQFDYYEAIGGGADYQAKFLKNLLTAIDNAIGEKK